MNKNAETYLDTVNAAFAVLNEDTAIDDISYLIRSEAEIDASVEDVKQKEISEEDEDDTQHTTLMDVENLENAVENMDISERTVRADAEPRCEVVDDAQRHEAD